MQVSLKQKFILISALMLVMVAILSLFSMNALKQIGLVSDNSRITQAIRNHMESDILHDAIRADMIAALLAARDQDRAALTKTAQDFSDHTTHFQAMIKENQALQIPEKIMQEMEKTSELAALYIGQGKSLLNEIQSGGSGTQAFQHFIESFEVLEGEMSAVSDLIEQWAEAEKANTIRISEDTKQLLRLLVLITVAINLFIPLLTVYSLFKPQQVLIQTMNQLSRGHKHVDIPYAERKDEIGNIARAVSFFKDSLIKVDELHEQQVREREQHEQEQKEMLHGLANGFELKVKGAIDTVSRAAKDMNFSALSMSQSAQDSAEKSVILEQDADEASRNVSTAASAAEELASSISEISRQVARAAKISRNAVAESDGANAIVHDLANAADKIGSIIKLINEIVEQINLLALNATIEAARAGEAGKGFAVVASEVKNLANQTTKATEDIRQSITMIQGATKNTVEKIGGIGKIISEMDEISTAIAGAVEEQGAATQEIARSVSQASGGTQAIAQNVKEVSKTIQDTGSTADLLLDAAGQLAKQAELVEREVQEFMQTIRQA